MLRATNVVKKLGGRAVLGGVELTCRSSQIILVLGRNGAGKSTLLRVLAGLLEPDDGVVSLNERSVHGADAAARREIGYLPDATDIFPELSARELVGLVEALKRVPFADEQALAWRRRLGLEELWNQRLRTLSLGQRKRCYAMAALVGDPWLLVLDEPTNGLDPPGCDVILEIVTERQAAGKATVVASNDPAFSGALRAAAPHATAPRATTIRRIDGGRLLDGDATAAPPR
jgi:ABC-type multidrug transport system ATPase subunit